MQSQRWHKEQKDQNDAQLDEKHQDQSSELFFVDFKGMSRPGYASIPKQPRGEKIEQRKCEADDKCAEEKVPEENDPFVFHAGTYFISKKPDQQ
jgi:hypothetical protein